jgi:hypothetical protein
MKHRRIPLVVGFLPIILYGLNYFLFQAPLNAVLERDERNAGMTVRAHWRYYVDPTVLVYDVRGVSPETSRLDVLRAFLQFAYRQKGRTFGRVQLCRQGAARFTIRGADFAELGRQYPFRSPVDTVPLVAPLLYRMDGTRAFPAVGRSPSAGGGEADPASAFDRFVDQWVALPR